MSGADAIDPACVDFDVFALFLEARRIHRGRSVARLAREAAVEVDDVKRAVRARNPGERQFVALCGWIGERPDFFIRKASA